MLEITPTIERQPDPAWDAFVEAAPGGSHLQTTAWAKVKQSAGWEPGYVVAREQGVIVGGCQLLIRRVSAAGSVAYVPWGPLVASGQEALAETLTERLLASLRSRHFLFVKLQPPEHGNAVESQLRNRGWIESAVPVAPDATTRVLVDRDDEALLASMRAETRRTIRRAEASSVEVRVGGLDDVATFGRLADATSRRQGFGGYPADYYGLILRSFGERARLLLAEVDGVAYAATLLIMCGGTVTYDAGAWSGERPELQAPRLLHWEGIRLARDLGYRYYDLYGIGRPVAAAIAAGGKATESTGVDLFKLAFGGEAVVLPPTLDRSFHPLGATIQRLAPFLSRHQRFVNTMLGLRRTPPGESQA